MLACVCGWLRCAITFNGVQAGLSDDDIEEQFEVKKGSL
jgi:hypothetical protein